MKIVNIFMAVLLLATTFYTCPEEGFCDDIESTELVETAKQRPDKSDLCSPFCQCARCPFSILLPVKQARLDIPNIITALFPVSPGPSTIRVNSSIWQPPRCA